jgi:hypothetical protein
MRYTYPMSKNPLVDLPIKICVSGARETSHCGLDALDMAEKIGGEIANHHCVLTGSAVAGFPMWAARGAKKAGGMTVGFSPASNLKEHAEVYRLPTDNLDMLVYTGFGYAGSDLLLSGQATLSYSDVDVLVPFTSSRLRSKSANPSGSSREHGTLQNS